MARYRRRFEIVADILTVADKGAKKTRIMYYANLSYDLLRKYLDDGLKSGFLCMDHGGYMATEKGRMFMEKYKRFSETHSKIKKDLEEIARTTKELERMCRLEETKVEDRRDEQHEIQS